MTECHNPILLAAVLALAASPSVAGQQPPDTVPRVLVEGEVIDASSGQPVPGVLVSLHDIWLVTRTDRLGYFRFDSVPRGFHELGVYGVGYESVEDYVDFNGDEIFEVGVKPAPIEIEGLTVEAMSPATYEYRSYGQRYDFIGPEKMEEYRLKYGEIVDMLRRLPGIRVWDPGGPASSLCVRNQRGTTTIYGGETNFGCALMFIDRIEANGQDVANLNPDDIQAIEYVGRLEARLRWGERGKYGVLLITTRTR